MCYLITCYLITCHLITCHLITCYLITCYLITFFQVAHIAGYDDEHHLEKAPILEIDPIPDERPKAQGIQKYQVEYYCLW